MPRVQDKTSGIIEELAHRVEYADEKINTAGDEIRDLKRAVERNENWLVFACISVFVPFLVGLVVWFGPYSTNQEAMAAAVRSTAEGSNSNIIAHWEVYNNLDTKINSLDSRVRKLEPTPKPTPVPTPNPCASVPRCIHGISTTDGPYYSDPWGHSFRYSGNCNCWYVR
jgi:hypothetical protein